MKSLRWMPLAYLAGLQGFTLFAPYAALLLALRRLLKLRQRRLASETQNAGSLEPAFDA